MTHQQNAPVFLNLFRIRMPAGAVASIAHRISGVLLFLSLPLLAWLLDLSLQGGEGYERAIALLQSTGVKSHLWGLTTIESARSQPSTRSRTSGSAAAAPVVVFVVICLPLPGASLALVACG